MFPDGRSMIATLGEKRFKVLSTWDQDGYTVAKVEYIEDQWTPEDSQKRMEDKLQLAQELAQTKLASSTFLLYKSAVLRGQ